ncbi:MAG TPA: hypothetical protein ENI23_12630 [bacterium]|nr:hypothetical protein [bacterium]
MEKTDEKATPDVKQETTPSVEEPNVKDTVPYSRFKEVIDDKNELKGDLKSLKESIEDLKQQQKPEPEEEPLDWKEAESRAVDKAVSRIEKKSQEKADADDKQEQAIERSFEQLEEIGQEITPAIKKAVLTKMIETGNSDVFGTYLKIKEQTVKTEKTEIQKKEGFVPPSDKGTVAGKTSIPYKQLRDTPLDDIVEQASKAK